MTPLPQVRTHPDFASFATEDWYLRPSSLGKLTGCAMSVFLNRGDSESGKAADTGNLVHAAAAAFHKAANDPEAGRAALDAARRQFPLGDVPKANQIFRAYAADPENAEADVVWCEQQVRLDLPAAPYDPTGKPIVILGTLDQVRRDRRTGRLTVWDIKTGDRLDATAILAEHLAQQCGYLMAARQVLSDKIEAGGLIYTPGYAKPRARRMLAFKNLTPDRALRVLAPVVHAVALVRMGVPLFRPSAESCAYCPVRPFDNCSNMFDGLYGRN